MRKLFLFLFVLMVSQLSAAAAVVVEEVIARVGNEIITKSEFEEEEKRLYEQMKRQLQGQELETQYQKQRKDLLDFLINQKLLEQRARELDLNVDEEINAAILRLREENSIPDDAALEQALTSEGSSMAQLREDFRRRIIQQRILWNYVQGKVNITEDEIKNYYEQHKSELTNPAVTKIRRYTITGEGIEKGILNAEARSLLNVLRKKMEVVPANFPNMKTDESVEVSATELDPKVGKILDQTAVGSYTELVEVPSGWAIFLVESRTEAKPISFDEARGQIYNVLLQERAQKYQKSFLEDLRKQNFVVINRPVQEN
jgi:peptidyl-prolyl cis-trans isomerase SurA